MLKKNGLTRHPKIKAELIPALAGLEDSPWGEWTALDGTATPHADARSAACHALRGRNVRIDYRWGAAGDADQIRKYARQQLESNWAASTSSSMRVLRVDFEIMSDEAIKKMGEGATLPRMPPVEAPTNGGRK